MTKDYLAAVDGRFDCRTAQETLVSDDFPVNMKDNGFPWFQSGAKWISSIHSITSAHFGLISILLVKIGSDCGAYKHVFLLGFGFLAIWWDSGSNRHFKFRPTKGLGHLPSQTKLEIRLPKKTAGSRQGMWLKQGRRGNCFFPERAKAPDNEDLLAAASPATSVPTA